jgi:two-component system, LuxR family, sensor kinase FixL
MASRTLVVLNSLLVTAVLAERRRRRHAQETLQARLRFERLLVDLTATFARLGPSEVEPQIEAALGKALEVLDVDRAALTEFGPGERVVRSTYRHRRPGIPVVGDLPLVERFPWSIARLRAGESVIFVRPEDLPPEAATDRRSFVAGGTRSLAAVPLAVGGAVVGVLRFATTRSSREWSAGFVEQLHVLSEIFGNALARRQADEALRETEDRFRSMADEAPVSLWTTDARGRVTFATKEALRFIGWEPGPEVGAGWMEFVHPDDRAACRTVYRQAADARRDFRVEYRARRVDGQYRWIVASGKPRFTGEGALAGYAGCCIDVTELREAQQSLLESTALRSAIFGALYGQVAAIDARGVIIAVNEAWTAALTNGGAAAVGASVGADYLAVCRRAGDDVDARRALAAIEDVLARRTPRASLEYPCHTPTDERWFEMVIEPLRRPEGGAVISHLDITARRHAEMELRAQREALAHALRVTTLGELVASLSHELSQPLTGIIATAQAARRLNDAPGRGHADVRESLDDIVGDGKRAVEIIRRLRALFRKGQAERKPVHLNEIVTEVVGLVARDALRRGVVIELALADHLPAVEGDRVQLQQVVLNLLVNGMEAMAAVEPPRTLTVTSTLRDARTLELRVQDRGVGVDGARLATIFDPFVSSKPEGLGMGLAISRSIVLAHGGRIWAAPNPGRGLTVHVQLPGDDASIRP